MNNTVKTSTLGGISFLALLLAFPFPYQWTALTIGTVVILLMVILGVRLATVSGIAWSPSIDVELTKRAATSLFGGFVLGAVVLFIMVEVIAPMEPRVLDRLTRDASVPLWKWAVILFHAPVLEEVIFRLFALSALAWTFRKLGFFAAPNNATSTAGLMLSNAVAAFLFALIHLPAWYQAGEVTPSILASVLSINILAGLVFGYVYLHGGIALAILAHLGADIVVHLGGRLLS